MEENRLIRDAALDEPNAYGRLRAAAGTAYWKGRLAHVYASSCVLKLRSRRPSKFLSRGLHMAPALASSGTALVGREHWRGFKDDQIPGSLSQVMQRIEQAGSEPGLTSGKGERWTVSDCLPPDRERLNMPMVIVVGPEDKIRVQEAKQGLAPRVDYRLIAEGFPGTTVEEWYPSPAFLHGTKPSRVARSLSANFSQAMASIKQLPPDSVIYSTGETWGIPMALALTLSGASHRHVVYVHRIFTAHWLALLRTLRPVMRVHGWICVTEHQRKLLARALGSRAAPVTAISQGVDTAFYNSASPVPTVASSYILAVGAEMRNYQLLFDAVRSLDVSVVVRPSSPWLQRPRSGFRRVPSNVSVVTQPLSYGDLRDLYANALLVAVPLRPTLQAAGITTILEAMAMGKCVVATKSQGLPDILCDGMTGAVVEQRVAVLRATLARCVADAAWRESLGDAGRRMVRDQASLEYHASQVTAFIHQAAGA